MSKAIDMAGWILKDHGVVNSEIIILEKSKEKTKEKGKAYWNCKCSCGNIFTAEGYNLRSGHTLSCGCLNKKKASIHKENLVNKVFGRLIVLEEDESYKKENNLKTGIYWKCLCECGNIITTSTCHLNNGNTKSCGCLQKEKASISSKKILTGKVFGKLTIIKEVGKNERGLYLWECKCECGNICIKDSSSLITGSVHSCGCISSWGETKIQKILEKEKISFERQKTFNNCRSPKTFSLLRFDFYINDEFLLEFDGKQHFICSNKDWNTKENFEKNKINDNYKNQWCKENNIPLKRIPYWVLDNLTIEDILSDRYLIKEEDENV